MVTQRGAGRNEKPRQKMPQAARSAAAGSIVVGRIAEGESGAIVLGGDGLFGDRTERERHRFVERLLTIDEVSAIEIRGDEPSAVIRYATSRIDAAGLLRKMVAALRRPPAGIPILVAKRLHAGNDPRRRLEIFRRAARRSGWRIVHELPGRVRLRHARMRTRPGLGRRIESDLHAISGILEARANPRLGSLLVQYDPERLDRRRLFAVLQQSLRRWDDRSIGQGGPLESVPVIDSLALVLAATAQWFVPALLPASALLLVATNVTTLMTAVRELRRRQFSPQLIGSLIVVVTLFTGDYLLAATMAWLLGYWSRTERRELAAAERRLTAAWNRQPAFVWMCREEVEVETPASQLSGGQVIALHRGDLVPAAGEVVDGAAVMTRPGVGMGLCVRPGDHISEGAVIVSGDLRVRISHLGPDPVLRPVPIADRARQDRSLDQPRMAERAVRPTLAMAGIGLAVGDLSTVAAVIRPDYVSGPRMAQKLKLLNDAVACADAGIVIPDATALKRLAEVDTIVLDHHPALERPAIELAQVRTLGRMPEGQILHHAATICRLWREHCFRQAIGAGDRAAALRVEVEPNGFAVSARLGGEWLTLSFPDAGWEALEPMWLSAGGTDLGMIEMRRTWTPEAAVAARQLRARGRVRVGLLSSLPESAARQAAGALGLDLYGSGLSPDDKGWILTSCRRRGLKVAFVGDCRRNAAAAAEAHVAVCLSGMAGGDLDPAPVVLSNPRLQGLVWLREVSLRHLRELRSLEGYAIVPNVISVAGALLAGFTGLHAVALTNLGTLAIYRKVAASSPAVRQGGTPRPWGPSAPVSSTRRS